MATSSSGLLAVARALGITGGKEERRRSRAADLQICAGRGGACSGDGDCCAGLACIGKTCSTPYNMVMSDVQGQGVDIAAGSSGTATAVCPVGSSAVFCGFFETSGGTADAEVQRWGLTDARTCSVTYYCDDGPTTAYAVAHCVYGGLVGVAFTPVAGPTVDFDPLTKGSASASCPPGQVAVGCGFDHTCTNGKLELRGMVTGTENSGCVVSFENTSSSTGYSANAVAICATGVTQLTSVDN